MAKREFGILVALIGSGRAQVSAELFSGHLNPVTP